MARKGLKFHEIALTSRGKAWMEGEGYYYRDNIYEDEVLRALDHSYTKWMSIKDLKELLEVESFSGQEIRWTIEELRKKGLVVERRGVEGRVIRG
jgi:biotin operon repressor